jgi:hypothetical protein
MHSQVRNLDAIYYLKTSDDDRKWQKHLTWKQLSWIVLLAIRACQLFVVSVELLWSTEKST